MYVIWEKLFLLPQNLKLSIKREAAIKRLQTQILFLPCIIDSMSLSINSPNTWLTYFTVFCLLYRLKREINNFPENPIIWNRKKVWEAKHTVSKINVWKKIKK